MLTDVGCFTIRIENNMIRDLPAGQSIIMGSTAQDIEDSVIDPVPTHAVFFIAAPHYQIGAENA